MKLQLEPIKAKKLRPGDLFMGAGNESYYDDPTATYIQAYMRTCQPPYKGQGKEDMLRIRIFADDGTEIWPRFNKKPDVIPVVKIPAYEIKPGDIIASWYPEVFARFGELRSVGELVNIIGNGEYKGGGTFDGTGNPLVRFRLEVTK